MSTTYDVRQSLLAQDSEFRRLSEQHALLDMQIKEITAAAYINAEDLIQEVELKKIKLRLKDEMERIVARHVHDPMQH
jgi:uncharacterized protein YdcH (DUF465 family)